jgi:hypothetical protein
MNEKNFDYLKDQVKYTGFGDSLEAPLKANLSKTQTEFRLPHQANYGQDEMSSSLHFKKSAQSDMYFFNSYSASLQKPGSTTPVNQTFFINKEGGNITQKEAFNLLDGRAVNKDLISKEGKIYNAWIQLDFKETAANGNYKMKQFSQAYGFDLEKSLAKLPIKELGNELERSRLIDSLQKGNRQAVTIAGNEGEQKRYVEANPQFKSITIYDEKHQRIRQSHTEKSSQQQSPAEQPSEKQNRKKQNVTAQSDEGEAKPRKTSKRKGMSV